MKIGIFDSGYGGLTILSAIRERLPEYDYLYLGDNARAPYGTRSFEVIYAYTLEAVRYLHSCGCRLIILACNTASAKALRSIQQHDLPEINSNLPRERQVNVLGVIRPTVEAVPSITRNGHIGILATPGTVSSQSYVIELEHIAAASGRSLTITQQPCPMWVPLIEAGEHNSPGADWFVKQYIDDILSLDKHIDTMVLGCTHYPLLLPKISELLAGTDIRVVAQGGLVADSLSAYLMRHTEIAQDLSRGKSCTYLTTESADKFSTSASLFLRQEGITATTVTLA